MQAAAVMKPDSPSTLVIMLSIPTVEINPYYLVEMVGLPKFGPTYMAYPILDEQFVALSHDSDHYFQLSEVQYIYCMTHTCKFNTPRKSLNVSPCGIGRYIAHKPPDCDYKVEPKVKGDYFLNLGEVGIVYSIVKENRVTLLCNSVKNNNPVILRGQGVLKLPSGCYGIAVGTPDSQTTYLRGPEAIEFTLTDKTLLLPTIDFTQSDMSSTQSEFPMLQPDQLLKVTVSQVRQLSNDFIAVTSDFKVVSNAWIYLKYGLITLMIIVAFLATCLAVFCVKVRLHLNTLDSFFNKTSIKSKAKTTASQDLSDKRGHEDPRAEGTVAFNAMSHKIFLDEDRNRLYAPSLGQGTRDYMTLEAAQAALPFDKHSTEADEYSAFAPL
jgi:hypothetical protein